MVRLDRGASEGVKTSIVVASDDVPGRVAAPRRAPNRLSVALTYYLGLSEPIAVTNTGCELLANVERKLFIK
jgi:hypothetical protein